MTIETAILFIIGFISILSLIGYCITFIMKQLSIIEDEIEKLKEQTKEDHHGSEK